MEKSDAVATLGEQAPALASLLRPAQVRAALKANDRLKLYLSVLQAAQVHAHHPREAALDLSREIAAADITVRAEVDWLHDLPATAASEGDGALRVPDLPRLALRLADDLGVMARPRRARAGLQRVARPHPRPPGQRAARGRPAFSAVTAISSRRPSPPCSPAGERPRRATTGA